jgi:hypothetical protein
MDNFNQSGHNGIWGRLENAVLATTGIARVSVLAGPVLAPDDPVYREVEVPLVFWKVLVYRPTGQQLRARAFLVTQSLKGLRAASRWTSSPPSRSLCPILRSAPGWVSTAFSSRRPRRLTRGRSPFWRPAPDPCRS